MTADKRQSVGDALGRDDQIGVDALVLAREHRAGAGESGLHLVGDEHDAVLAAPVEQCRQEALGGHDEPALALDRLDDHGGEIVGADLLVDDAEGALGGELAVGGQLLAELRVAERVGHRRAVDLGGEGAEAVLVGHRLRRQRHRQVGAAVIGVVEGDDRLLARVGPCDLDGVLDGLGPGVEQRRPLFADDRGEPVEVLADGDVLLVGRDHEAGMRELGGLRGHGVDDAGRGVADGRDRDARAQVDQPVAVDVLDDAAARAGRVHRHGGSDATGYCGVLALDQLLGPRTGDRGG